MQTVSEPPSFWLHIAAFPSSHTITHTLAAHADAPFHTIPLRTAGFLEATHVALGLCLLVAYALLTLCAAALANPSRISTPWQQQAGMALPSLQSVQLARRLSLVAAVWLLSPSLYQAFLRLLQGFFLLPQQAYSHSMLAALFAFGLFSLIYLVLHHSVYALSISYRQHLAALLIPWLRPWQLLSTPLLALIRLLSKTLLRLLSPYLHMMDNEALPDGVAAVPVANPQQLLESLRHSNLDERKLLSNVLEFSNTSARDIMVPRPDVVWLNASGSLGSILDRIHNSGHTRFPVCEDSPDNVIGYLHAKDLNALIKHHSSIAIDVRQLVRPVAFVPEAAKAMTLLKRFQEEHSHLAIVVDEFGGMSGVVTLEDLLEELVGDIRDEFDVEEPDIRTLESGEIIVDGGMRLEELEKTLGLYFGDAEEDTIGGYIFGQLAREVHPGEQLLLPNAILRVEAVEGLRITHVRIIFQASQPSAAGNDAASMQVSAASDRDISQSLAIVPSKL